MINKDLLIFPAVLRFTSRLFYQTATFFDPLNAIYNINLNGLSRNSPRALVLYNLSTYLRRILNASSIFFKSAAEKIKPTEAIYGIDTDPVVKKTQRALIIYDLSAIPYLVKNRLDKYPNLIYHSRYWETAEMVRLLNHHGFLVDFFHYLNPPSIKWDQYDLVIDGFDNLKNAPKIAGQKKVFYATGSHWLFQNRAELLRIKQFFKRNHLYLPPNRQAPVINSDLYADYMTYFGTDFQLSTGFCKKVHQINLNISSCYVPKTFKKDVQKSKQHFLWFGGGGMILKGLDLVVEAFAQIPQAILHIVGNFSNEPEADQWLRTSVSRNSNIIFHGWMDVSSPVFQKIARECIGIVYTSCSEGGPGSIAQVLHFGLIPIVTRSSNVRGEQLGFSINSEDDRLIIDFIIKSVEKIMRLKSGELSDRSEQIKQFALKNHTRKAYSQSFAVLIEQLK